MQSDDEALPKWSRCVVILSSFSAECIFTLSRPLVYPREGKKKAEVDIHDFERLRDGEFLNDNLIGFYLRFLEHHLERTKPEASRRTYFFNSYFFATLTNTAKGKRGINYEGVQKWTRNVDLFSHDYVIVPINEAQHWYLAIICNLSSLQRKEEESADADPTHEHREVLSQSIGETREEIPETPPNAPGDEPVETTELAEQLPLETNGEETTRQSFASMTLSETEPTNVSQRVDVSKEHSHESDEDWPEKEENPTSSPPKFSSARDSSRSADGAEVEHIAEQSQECLTQKTTKQKKKGRPLLRKHDTHKPIIVTFDSLGARRYPAIRALRAYLLEEAMSKRSLEVDPNEIKGMTAEEIPLQPNFSDCGLYLLAYLEKFAQDPDLFVERLLQREMSADADWPPLKSGLLRRRLRDFLYKLQEEQENIRSNKVSSEKILVDKKPISFLLGPEQLGEEHTVPDSAKERLEEEVSEGIKSSKTPEADTPKSIHTRVLTSHSPNGPSHSRTGDIDAQHVERQESIGSLKERTDQPEVVDLKVKPDTDRTATARPKTPETSRSEMKELTLRRNNAGVPSTERSDRVPRSSPRLSRKVTGEKSSTSPISRHHEPRHRTPGDKWIDELYDMTGSPKVTVEVQVPGTPPSSSRSGVVRGSPRSSPRQVKSRNKE